MPQPSHAREFERQVQNELGVLFRVARRMGASAEQSEDLVQVTLVKAFQAWGSFDGRFLRSWLIKILRNEHLMNLRSDRHDISIEDTVDIELADGPFWDEVSWKIEVEQILMELESLPDIYQMAIQLIDVEQMSYEEAAEALQIPIGTVRSRLFRGRELLRNRMTVARDPLKKVKL